MRVGLLGAVEVIDDAGREVSFPVGKQKALLALLALHAGRSVTTEQLIDSLWGDDPPPSVRNGLQALVSKLRGSLGGTDLVVMRGSGYALQIDPASVDVHRFEALIERAQTSVDDRERAVALFAEAESLWRGEPLAEFAYEDFAQPTIHRLSELRLVAVEKRIELELELGRVDAALVELETLVRAHPLRERLRALLMTALYRAGRQADALRVYQEGRHVLGEELGLEPGPELRRVEAAILAQAASLDGPEPARTVVAVRTKAHPTIPPALTPLVGRDEELAELVELCAANRFVSLVGPGGVGKSRLALEIARTSSASFDDGACLVELAPVGDPAAVRAAIAAALDIPDGAQLEETLGDRELLVLLDNCEHVIAAAADVVESLLRSCPRVRVVATSREALRARGETVWPVPPLASEAAVTLFVERARAADARLALSDDDRPVIVDICARLDGLPLAIELAAARTRALPITQIASRLDDRFRLLTGGARTALPRQQTLRAVVDWSYDLLFDDERRVFERLSVLPAGCDLDTAAALLVDDVLTVDDVAEILHALVDKSLVLADRSHDTVRFTQLQTLAQYGREKLTERGDAQRVLDAMTAHFAALCSDSAAAFAGHRQREWLRSIDRDMDNVRAALEWAVAREDAGRAMAIAGGASWPHWLAGTAHEGKRWLDEAFVLGVPAEPRTLGLGLVGRGLLGFLTGSSPTVDADLSRAVSIFREIDDAAGLSLAFSFYAEVPRTLGDLDEARRRRTEALEFSRSVTDRRFADPLTANSLAVLAVLDGDLDSAERHYREAAEGFTRTERPMMLAITLGLLADFDERAGRHADTVAELGAAVRLSEDLGMRGFLGALLSRLAWAQLQAGALADAEATSRRGLALVRPLRNPWHLLLALTGAALVHRSHGRNSDAAAAAGEALAIRAGLGPRAFRNRIDPDLELASASAACCAVLGVVAGDDGHWDRAARLLGHAERLRREHSAPTPAFQAADVERARELGRAAIGAAAFEAAWSAGSDATLAELMSTDAVTPR